MTSKQKSYIVAMFIFVTFIFLFCYFYRFSWLFSLVCGFISYIVLMIVTFKSIKVKIHQKIQEAKRQDLQDSSLKNGCEMGDISQDSNSNRQTSTSGVKVQNRQNTEKTQIIQKPQDSESKNSKNSSSNPKKILRFLDLSKVSLGFEFSFSLSRVLAFLFMILCFVLLIIYNIFHPIIYLIGVFLALVCVLLWLFTSHTV